MKSLPSQLISILGCTWSYSIANDPETANDPQKWTANDPRPQVIPKLTVNDPERKIGMAQ